MSPKSTFVNSKGESQSFFEYYKNIYGKDIKDHNQPMLVSMKKVSGKDEPFRVVLAPELCLVTGMTESMRSDFRVMKDVAEYTRKTPAKRQEIIDKLVQKVQKNEDAKQYLDNWGLSLEGGSFSLEGRVIGPTTLQFGNGYKEMVGPKGDWSRSAGCKPVLSSVNLDKWIILFPEKDQQIAQKFSQALAQAATKIGFGVRQPKPIGLPNDRIEGYLKSIRETPDDAQMTVCLFPGGQRADRYAAVKKLCYVDQGRLNQVIMIKNLQNEKRFHSIVQKIALQIECKLGGQAWGCSIPIQGLMFIGVDIYR